MLWFITAIAVGLSAWFGAARMAARDWRALAAGLALPLAAGGLCGMIAETKSGFLAGLLGALLALLLFVAAAAEVLGALGRRVYEWWRPPAAGHVPAAPGWLGVLGMGLFSGLAVLASALE